MKAPSIYYAKQACEAAKARQAVLITFDDHGCFTITSYGVTKAECVDVRTTNNAIADMLADGRIPAPGCLLADNLGDEIILQRIENES